jgi:hypothetical protein
MSIIYIKVQCPGIKHTECDGCDCQNVLALVIA